MEQRKTPRLKNYDYSGKGAYFVTVCVKNRLPLLSVVGRGDLTPPTFSPCVELSSVGEILDKHIRRIEMVYSGVTVDNYVIMPNHFHLLLSFKDCGGVRAPRPTISTIIRTLKTMVTREIGEAIFQTSFYDHIIRDEQDYFVRWKYIDENPAKWAEDEYF